MDLGELLAAAERDGPRSVAGKWAAALAHDIAPEARLVSLAVITFQLQDKVLMALAPQIVFGIAQQLEVVVGDSYRSGAQRTFITCKLQDVGDDAPSRVILEKRLLQYVLAARRVVARNSGRQFHMLTDKAWIGGLPLQMTVQTLPSGHAILCCPAVDSAFDGATATARLGLKRTAEVCPEREQQVKRHRAYLHTDSRPHSWRPQKQYRVSAKRWCSNLDLQFRVTNSRPGLVYFKRDPEVSMWQDSFLHPHCMIGLDLGSDGLAGYVFMERELKLNVDMTPDVSHGGNRDVINMLHETNLFQLWLLWVISMNLPYGPDRDDQRGAQIREALQHALQDNSPATSPLFMAHSSEMLDELRCRGVDTHGTHGEEQFVWDFLAERPRTAGRRVAMNRFHASISASMFHEQNWLFDQFERTYLALETDCLSGRKLQERIALRLGVTETVPEAGAPVRAHVHLEDRGLKSACQNCIAISVMVLQSITNRRVINCVTAGASKVLDWHSEQNRQLRSCDATARLLLSQTVGGAYMAHVVDIFSQISDLPALQKAGFRIPGLTRVDECDILVDDDMADIFASIQLSLGSNRIRRSLWFLLGWPHRLVRCLAGDGEAALTIQVFKADW